MTVIEAATLDHAAPPGSRRRPALDRGDVAHLSDHALALGIADGSHDAMAEAYQRHRASVQGVARHLCGAAQAADVTQEVFLALWRTPGRFDPERGSLRAFLVVQAHGRAIDVVRSETARRAREGVVHGDSTRVPLVEEVALARLAGHGARSLLERLGAAERQAITLAYFGENTYREVARLLDLPEGTVKSRIRTGLRRLRAHEPLPERPPAG